MQNEQREVKRFNPTSRNIPRTISHRPRSALLTPNFGLTIVPYRVQSAVPSDLNIRSRPISANVRQRQSLLSSSSLLAEDTQSSTNAFHYRLSQRSRSNAK